jgi:3-phenylpropionate/trans-cinnamate dioxygenase ferredoxin reductase component
LGTAVTGIDRGRREVTLPGGGHLAYGRLLLATGAVPRRLPLPGADADGVLYLRKVGDSDPIRDTFAAASRVLVIGAGWIGLEVAAAARAAGVDVNPGGGGPAAAGGSAARRVAPVFAGLHREHGVDLRLGVRVAEVLAVRVAAGMNVNVWDVNDAIGALIRSGQPVAPARLADPAIPLEEAVAR